MRQSGFTLLELSIVLVIIGLIIGGVTVGSALIEQAKVQAALSQHREYEAVFKTFRLKYNALPGDMTNASSYWPDCDSPATNCNGDGNGLVQYTNDGVIIEWAKTWRILGLSGLLPGNYDGDPHIISGTPTCIPGANCPVSKIDKGRWYFGWTTIGEYETIVGGRAINSFWLNHVSNSQGIMTPAQAEAIDRKTDDGNPGTGKTRGYNGDFGGSGCVNGGYQATNISYQLSGQSDLCAVQFIYQ